MQSVNPSVKSKSIRGGCRSQEATPWQLFMDSPQKMVCPLLVVGICFFFDCIFFKISLLEMIYPKFVFLWLYGRLRKQLNASLALNQSQCFQCGSHSLYLSIYIYIYLALNVCFYNSKMIFFFSSFFLQFTFSWNIRSCLLNMVIVTIIFEYVH